MAKDQNPITEQKINAPDLSDKNIGIIVSETNGEFTRIFQSTCFEILESHGILRDNIYHITVPDVFEIPIGARLLAAKEKLDVVICIGCIILNGSKAREQISQAVTQGILNMSISSGKPMVLGILVADDDQSAASNLKNIDNHNKGQEAALKALKLLALAHETKLSKSKIGFGG